MNDCVFCKLISGEFQPMKVYEDAPAVEESLSKIETGVIVAVLSAAEKVLDKR